jgi:hypothetical protein
MFAKLAQIHVRHVGDVQHAGTANTNRAGNGLGGCLAMAATRRARRPILICHWRHAPGTGALECVWEAASAPATGEPRRQRLLGETRRLNDARAAARRPIRRAAA